VAEAAISASFSPLVSRFTAISRRSAAPLFLAISS
jgi:hypothetical protein